MTEAEKTEKITLNLSLVDLGQIDLLVQEGFYANRTDFLRTAARAQLAVHAEALQRTVERKTIVLGLESHTRQQLEIFARLAVTCRFAFSAWPPLPMT